MNDEGPLTPAELEPDDERLHEIDDGRYVVSTDEEASAARADESVRNEGPTAEKQPSPDGSYAVRATLRWGGETYDLSTGSDDVSETFTALVAWYAEAVSGRDAETAVPVLLSNTEFE